MSRRHGETLEDMMIISSQRYIDNDILNAKIAELEESNETEVTLKTYIVGIDDLEILPDGHHILEAARQLGITVRYESGYHPEGLTGEDLLEQSWMDSDWYDIETGRLAF